MNIRQANTSDADAVREVARDSLEASYEFLEPAVIESALETWYDAASLEDALGDPDALFLVVEDDGAVVAFSQSVLVHRDRTTGELDWLHVAPRARDGGVGARLLERTEEALREMGADRVVGLVLAGNEVGAEFYTDQGYAEVDRREVTVGGETFEEVVFRAETAGGTDAVVLEDTVETDDGETLYLAPDEADRGSEGAFVPLYRSPDREGLWGLLCEHCRSTAVAVDSMGRAECGECGNRRKPTRWDAVYL